MIPMEKLSDYVHKSSLSQLDKLLLILAVEHTKPKQIGEIRNIGRNAGLVKIYKWNIPDALTKSRDKAIHLPKGWIIKGPGKDRVRNIINVLEIPKTEETLIGTYVDKKRIVELKNIKCHYDLTRLVQMLYELDDASSRNNYISVIMLVRAILDHVPPLFGNKNFLEFANNYNGGRSFKESMVRLQESCRKIADSYLHGQIRTKESLPNRIQINFSNDIDLLLSEIIRINSQ
ncbi:MAG TPA: hypothetical protein DEE98_05105 [Elusimicrobia bacterium]|nr:MAG: hypothetical protein A2278_04780 [Elusimicrobia bacterium RIFOXYA12_FULL_49_49]OGS06250.1 MAG: hypothetical protein A2204_06145 [Elusimicrobia bacterium RIFOXYA1_FULL_47_7]OGS10226.1 MAG: hypothetical protein A2386_07995 [Elusimicrobia bacterium RIFOXYB1_FULL_48_9]OGS14638.1 MAG: hypothetical protein A2251_09060 [Elusimicrobia bacterium RIFOXYA2_FULL_47_53]OGS25709.1 MAG: hypothetical protein A2339_06530 [Elusimicrobia bacterium RIFOXYB12_FULL_50_12]OGS31729.1 MAG: hypothetical protein